MVVGTINLVFNLDVSYLDLLTRQAPVQAVYVTASRGKVLLILPSVTLTQAWTVRMDWKDQHVQRTLGSQAF